MTRSRSHTDSEDSIAAALDRLREELAVVRQVLDEIQQELEWANRNSPDREQVAATYRRITSMPLDPCAPDWAERVNQYSAADLPADVRDPTPRQQGQLF
jgi:hypothetical protein